MISISEELIEQIKAHGEKTYPNECGGMLIGHFENDKKTVSNFCRWKTRWRKPNSIIAC